MSDGAPQMPSILTPMASQVRANAMSCGGITPDLVEQVAKLDPKVAEKLEAILVLARSLKDGNGKLLFMTLPPALCLAIIRTLEDENPTQKAHQFSVLNSK